MYERLIKDIKKTLYKTLGSTHLTFEQLEAVVINIEKHLNNRPLTYVESSEGELQVLTPNVIMWGQNAYEITDIEVDEKEVIKLYRRLNNAREHAWRRWKREYVHSLMEADRVSRGNKAPVPEIGEIVLVVGEERNRGEWKKAKVIRHLKGHLKGKDGVILLHRGHQTQRPLQLVCPLEIRCSHAEDAGAKIRLIVADD